MKFQILDADGKALSLETLDRQAAKVWHKEIDPEYYANPFEEEVPSKDASLSERMRIKMRNAERKMGTSWFQTIGLTIASQQDNHYYKKDTWEAIVYDLIHHTLYESLIKQDIEGLFKMFDFTDDGKEMHLTDSAELSLLMFKNMYEPYLKLINEWMSNGYRPKQL